MKGNFTTRGTKWVHSLDGHAKLIGYQRDTFPIAIYGCIDTASQKLLWIKVWTSNSNPDLVGRWYFEHLYESRILARVLRIDKGTETGNLATIHAFLRQKYGPSTANQIERWWRELHERFEQYFKLELSCLLNQGHYDPQAETDRKLMAYLFIPLVDKHIQIFKDTIWNTHRIRRQAKTYLPDGVPDHIYNFPEEYGLKNVGWLYQRKICVKLLQCLVC